MSKNIFTFTGVLVKEDRGYSSLCIELDVASQTSRFAHMPNLPALKPREVARALERAVRQAKCLPRNF